MVRHGVGADVHAGGHLSIVQALGDKAGDGLLGVGQVIRRYQTTETDNGVKGGEGLFIPCSFWLVDALNAAGQQRDAISLFEKLLRLRNDVGLLSEEWDPAAQRQLGNTPQAFSHFALVISALQLHSGTTARSDHPMQAPGPTDNAALYHDEH